MRNVSKVSLFQTTITILTLGLWITTQVLQLSLILLQYCENMLQVAVTVKKNVCKQVRVKKLVPNKKGDIGMEVYYLCQPNTYVIAITAAQQIHEQ